jgi:tRNA pseudouridine38-40 synthase
MRNVLIEIEYDGSGFHGWQLQPEVRTVQGMLEAALSHVCGQAIRLNGVSRTDAGVHAFGQRASFKGDYRIPAERIPVAVNNHLKDARIIAAKEMPLDFHARFDAVGKSYFYRIQTGGQEDIFQRNFCYQLNESLNTGNMKEAAARLIGTHDFAAFCASGGKVPETTVRTIYGVDVAAQHVKDAFGHDRDEVRIRVTGNGFLYNMVRIITGTLVEIGLGKRQPKEMQKILDERVRGAAGHTAPSTGLYLERVYYDMETMIKEAKSRTSEVEFWPIR